MSKKYLVIGGYVTSKTDGDRHYIYPGELCRLYGLDPRSDDVTLVNSENSEFLRGFVVNDFIVLRPRYDGDYTLPEL